MSDFNPFKSCLTKTGSNLLDTFREFSDRCKTLFIEFRHCDFKSKFGRVCGNKSFPSKSVQNFEVWPTNTFKSRAIYEQNWKLKDSG